MIPSQHRSLLQSIATTITDYRQGEIDPITPEHVETWVSQFDPEDQPVILREVDNLLTRFYFSRTRIKEYLHEFIKTTVIGGRPPLQVLSHVQFLQIQESGNSQIEMLGIVNEILHEEYRMDISQCGSSLPDTFIYLDDGVYTGNRLRYDLTPGRRGAAWISNKAPANTKLIIYMPVLHKQGYEYAIEYIEAAASAKGLAVEVWRDVDIDNCCQYGSTAECMWPEMLKGDTNVDWYVRECRQRIAQNNWSDTLFRPTSIPSNESVFTSAAARRQVEWAFLKVGARLVYEYQSQNQADPDRAKSIRPLGFEKLESLGFGTPFITYRNISNNCPLAFWSRVGGWYPLFPRRTNNQSSSMMTDDVPF